MLKCFVLEIDFHLKWPLTFHISSSWTRFGFWRVNKSHFRGMLTLRGRNGGLQAADAVSDAVCATTERTVIVPAPERAVCCWGGEGHWGVEPGCGRFVPVSERNSIKRLSFVTFKICSAAHLSADASGESARLWCDNVKIQLHTLKGKPGLSHYIYLGSKWTCAHFSIYPSIHPSLLHLPWVDEVIFTQTCSACSCL